MAHNQREAETEEAEEPEAHLSPSTSSQPPPVVTPQQIRAVPVIQPSTSTRRGSAILVTSSPHKSKLEAASAKKNGPPRKRQTVRDLFLKHKRRKPACKKTPETSSDSECSDDLKYVSTDDEDSDDDAECPACGKRFSSDKHGEKWIRCTKCVLWHHELCCTTTNPIKFICDSCLEG